MVEEKYCAEGVEGLGLDKKQHDGGVCEGGL